MALNDTILKDMTTAMKEQNKWRVASFILRNQKTLKDMGCHRGMVSMQGLGYKEIIPYLRGEWTLDKAVYELKLGTRHYAKRQLTWMRREPDVLWVDRMDKDAFEQLEKWTSLRCENIILWRLN